MASLPGIIIKIGAETRDAIQGINRVNKSLGTAASNSQKFNAAMGKAGKAAAGALAGAAVAAAGLAVKIGVDGVNAAIDDMNAQAKLAKTLKNLGMGKATDQVEANIDAMMRATGVADDDLRPAYAQLISVTKDVTEANALLQAALDLSAAKGIPLATATKAVAKSAAGSATALGRIAPELGKIDLKGDPAAKTLAAVNKQFRGQAATNAGTIAGKMNSLATAFNELEESFGTGLLSDLGGATTTMSDLTTLMYENRGTVEDFGASLASVAGSLLSIAGALADVKGAIEELPGGMDTLNSLGNIVGGPTMAIGGAAQAWNDWRNPKTAIGAGATGSADRPWTTFDPVRYAANAQTADGRARARGAKTGGRP